MGSSAYSPVAQVTITAPVRQITLVNQISTSLFLHQVVCFKVSQTNSFGVADFLTPDDAAHSECQPLPGKSIQSGASQTFDIPYSSYYVFIAIGTWDLDNFTCSTYAPFFKRRWFTNTQNQNYYVWAVIQVTNQNSGNWTWTISGSYLDLTLVVTPAGNSPLQFQRTSNDPL